MVVSAGQVDLRAVEIALLRREHVPLMPKPGASSPEAAPTSTRKRSGQLEASTTRNATPPSCVEVTAVRTETPG